MAKSSSSTTWSVNKISFWSIVAVTVCYILATVFGLIGVAVLATIANVLRAIATAVLLLIVAVHAWHFVSGKSIAYKVLYFICVIVAFAGIVFGAF